MQNKNIYESLMKLDQWVERANWKGYDTFDGLSSPCAKFFTFNNPLLKQCWQQGVRRFPINLRPLLGIKPGMSTKGMGFFAQGYLRLYQTHGDAAFLEKAKFKHSVVDDCAACHNSHGGAESNLLIKNPQQLCGECHEPKDMAAIKDHKDMGTTACLVCHDHHVGSNKGLIKPPKTGAAPAK